MGFEFVTGKIKILMTFDMVRQGGTAIWNRFFTPFTCRELVGINSYAIAPILLVYVVVLDEI